MRVLVTGGAGFIGSHLVDRLLDAGHEVRVFDNYSTGSAFNLWSAHQRGARTITGSVAWRPDVDRAFAECPPDVVYHLAAQVDVRRSAENPGQDADTNVLGTLHMLQAAELWGVQRFVFVSSSAVFGDCGVQPADLHTAYQPISPYGASKAAAEGYVAMYGRRGVMAGLQAANPVEAVNKAMKTTTVLFSNVYGPRQRGGAVGIFARALLRGELVTLYGDGRNVRDYVYVDDAVRRLLWAGCCLGTDPDALRRDRPQRLIVGTGVGTTDAELLQVILQDVPERLIPGEVLPARFEPHRPCDIRSMVLENGLGNGYTQLTDGVAITVQAIREELDREKK